MQISGFKRAWAAYAVIRRTFGVRFKPLLTGLLILFVRLLVFIGRQLDAVFYPSLRRNDQPDILVVAGNPRSGTTFLHRYLIANGVGAGAELRQLLWPSIVLQKIVTPLLPWLEKVSPASHHSAVAHQTSLTSPETDDAALLFRYLDGFFLYGFILAWSREPDYFPWFDHRKRDTSIRDYNWLSSIWHRVLLQSGQKRVIPKLFSVSVKVPRFLQCFPESRILYLVRDPLEMIPSGMSLVTGVLDARFGFWKLPDEKRQHYLTNLYQALVELQLRFHEDWVSGAIDRSRVMVIPYPRMMQQFETVMAEVIDFIGHDADEEFLKSSQETAESQRQWKSSHSYDLERFGLQAKQIQTDCRAIYDTFLNPDTMNEINRP